MFEILYLSIAIVAVYQALFLLSRGGPPQRPYAYLLLADGVLAGVAFFAARSGDESATRDLVGAVSIFAFVGLVLVPPILRELARWAVARDHLRLAMSLLGLRELLQPGLGAARERELLEAVLDVRAGRVEQVIQALRARRVVADPATRRALDERIILTLLYAGRWREAIEAYERAHEVEGQPASLQLVVEIIRAYGEEGDLDRAADLVERLERSAAPREPALLPLVHRARMLFLAFAGRPEEVEALVRPAGTLGALPPAVRTYWIGTARLFAGDRAGAREALAEALTLSRNDRRGHQVASERMRAVADETLEVPRALSLVAHDLADRVAQTAKEIPAAPPLPSLEGVGARTVPVTYALVALNILVAGLVTWRLGSSEDPWVLARAGANLKPAVHAGEWWRLHASTFLHVGLLHLVVNMFGVWSLGRLVEQFLGSARFFVVYSLAGVGGALASLWWGPSGISAGASGALFGILGAAIVELALRRAPPGAGRATERWRRGLLGNLLFIALANLAIGASYPIIDQAAHVGGLVVGMVATLALAPGRRFGRSAPVRAAVALLVAASVGSAAWAAWGAATTTPDETIERVGWARRVLGGVSVEVPRLWREVPPDLLVDPTVGTYLKLQRLGVAHVAGIARLQQQELEDEADTREVVEVEPSIPAPAPWRTHELRAVHTEGNRAETFRYLIYDRDAGPDGIAMIVRVPERRIDTARAVVLRMLASIEPER